MEKTFRGELNRIRDLLRGHTPFALSRYGHAEMEILQGKLMHDRGVSGGHEYRYAPADPGNDLPRQRLWDSFTYSRPNYLVGINCPHCSLRTTAEEKLRDFEWMRDHSGQPEDRLTFATIYFYSNYIPYLNEVVPLFGGYQTVLVCNEICVTGRLPFRPKQVYRNRYDAWHLDWPLVDETKRYISETGIRGGLFLFCAGVFGCMLAHQLFEFCPENTYLDAGSSLDPYLYSGTPAAKSRRYLKQDPDTQAQESCQWVQRVYSPHA